MCFDEESGKAAVTLRWSRAKKQQNENRRNLAFARAIRDNQRLREENTQLKSMAHPLLDEDQNEDDIIRDEVFAERKQFVTVLHHGVRASTKGFTLEDLAYSEEILMKHGPAVLNEIRKTRPLPSVRYMESLIAKSPTNLDLTDDTNFAIRIKQFMVARGISQHDGLTAVLATDAFAVVPNLTADEHGKWSGFTEKSLGFHQILSTETLRIYRTASTEDEKTRKLTELGMEHWDKAIKNAFGYQIQPLDPRIPCFMVFVEAAADGKAKDNERERLKKIHEACTSCHVTLLSYATDGDNGYDVFHDAKLDERIHEILIDGIYWKKKGTHIISDVLHVIKRARYRLFGSELVSGFSNQNPERFTMEDIRRKLFALPGVVFKNDSATKMHDTLPSKLFNFANLLTLFEDRRLAAAFTYFAPFVLLHEANTNAELPIELRVLLFQIICCFCATVLQGWSHFALDELGEYRKDTKARTLFDKKMMKHTLSTAQTQLYILYHEQDNGPVSLNRSLTTALERRFGVARYDAKFVQTFQNVIRTMNVRERLKLFASIDKSRKRKLSYGVILEPYHIPDVISTEYNPLAIAQAMLALSGFQIPEPQPGVSPEIMVPREWTDPDLQFSSMRLLERFLFIELMPFVENSHRVKVRRSFSLKRDALLGVSPTERRTAMLSSASRIRTFAERESKHIRRRRKCGAYATICRIYSVKSMKKDRLRSIYDRLTAGTDLPNNPNMKKKEILSILDSILVRENIGKLSEMALAETFGIESLPPPQDNEESVIHSPYLALCEEFGVKRFTVAQMKDIFNYFKFDTPDVIAKQKKNDLVLALDAFLEVGSNYIDVRKYITEKIGEKEEVIRITAQSNDIGRDDYADFME